MSFKNHVPAIRCLCNAYLDVVDQGWGADHKGWQTRNEAIDQPLNIPVTRTDLKVSFLVELADNIGQSS